MRRGVRTQNAVATVIVACPGQTLRDLYEEHLITQRRREMQRRNLIEPSLLLVWKRIWGGATLALRLLVGGTRTLWLIAFRLLVLLAWLHLTFRHRFLLMICMI